MPLSEVVLGLKKRKEPHRHPPRLFLVDATTMTMRTMMLAMSGPLGTIDFHVDGVLLLLLRRCLLLLFASSLVSRDHEVRQPLAWGQVATDLLRLLHPSVSSESDLPPEVVVIMRAIDVLHPPLLHTVLSFCVPGEERRVEKQSILLHRLHHLGGGERTVRLPDAGEAAAEGLLRLRVVSKGLSHDGAPYLDRQSVRDGGEGAQVEETMLMI